MSARKKKRATKKKTIRNARQRAKDVIEVGLRDLERRLPSNLRGAVRDMRGNLRSFQQQIDRSRRERDARWRRIETQLRRDMVRLLQRLEKAVAPPAASRAAGSASRRTKR
jgi:hypothetical protein